MTEEDKKIALEVMGVFLNSRDPKGYTKETLLSSYKIEESIVDELVSMAYREWSEAYGA
jgi:hypothetical protein